MSTATSSKGYVPPQFGRFGKLVKDLFKKKYDYDMALKTINKSSRGVTLEAGSTLGENGQLRGVVKGNYPVSGTGEGSWEISTDAAQESKANFKFTTLAKGMTLNVLTQSKDKNFKKPVMGMEMEYGQEFFSGSLVTKSDLDTHRVEASGCVGSDGFSVGGSVIFDMSHGGELRESNFGAEYQTDDFTASVFTEKNRSVLNAGYFQRITRDHQVGALFKQDMAGNKQERTLTIGNDFRLDADTTLRTKMDLPSGDVSTAIEHRLSNPKLLLGVATQFNPKSSKFVADKVGVSISFGDY